VAEQNGFTIEEKDIPFATLGEYDGAFLTSTSTKILPIRKVDDLEYTEIPASLKNLMLIFDKALEKEVSL
jgi:branched-subunit amino acid aminotransferase/4-amino-4-deoxychorismate lyase